MAASGNSAPSTPTSNDSLNHVQRYIHLQQGLDAPGGTASSSATVNTAPHTPFDAATAQMTSLPSSDISSAAIDSQVDEKNNDTGSTSSSPHVDNKDKARENNDPFITDRSPSTDMTPYRPRSDRYVGMVITPELAQAIFPSSACVFVANLVAGQTDEAIRDAVSDTFSAFGRCYVKVKRDKEQMPYAFCQYENVDDSNRAIVQGRQMNILGRPCRTERAKVNRSLYLSRMTGGPITDVEAREILDGRGDIQSLWHSPPTDLEMFRLPEGIWVQFAFFQDSRDAAAAFKDNTEFRLEQPQLPEDLRAKLTNARNNATPAKTPLRQAPYNTPASRYSNIVDATSIFIGNLSTSVSLDSLRTVFGKFGSLRNIEIICRPGVTGNAAHAFVEYDSPRAADRALNSEHVLGNVQLRVERRQSTPCLTRSTSNSRLSNGSPRRRSLMSMSSNGTMPTTPFSGSLFPPDFHRHGPMNAEQIYPMAAGMQAYFPGPFTQAPHGNPGPMQSPAHPMMFGSPASGHHYGDNGYSQLAYQPVAPPHFAMPLPMQMIPSASDPKASGLPTVPEHQG